MAAGLRAVGEIANLVDVVVEVRDARLVRSTAVAALHSKLRSKPRITVLNRSDLAEDAQTRAWCKYLAASGEQVFSVVATMLETIRGLRGALLAWPSKRAHLRIAVVGAPNTGKSSLINTLVGRKRAKVANIAGITRRIHWIALSEQAHILDTPGILQPRIHDQTAAWQLGLCGTLPYNSFDSEDVAEHFQAWLARHRPLQAAKADLETFAAERGMLRKGGEANRRNAAQALITSFRTGEFGPMTFERVVKPK